jgi:hypothetical protein
MTELMTAWNEDVTHRCLVDRCEQLCVRDLVDADVEPVGRVVVGFAERACFTAPESDRPHYDKAKK